MKKVLSILISTLIVFSIIPHSFAADGESKELERVLALVIERLPSTEDYEDFDSDFYSGYNGSATYDFYWSSRADESFRSMSVSALSNGFITHFSIYDEAEREQKPVFDRMEETEALAKARILLKKLNPELSENLVILSENSSEQFRNNGFSFSVIRTENGIPVIGDTGRLEIDLSGEKITDFYISYSEGLSFENGENSISLEEAKKAFTEKIGLELTYRAKFDYESESILMFPSYSVRDRNVYISATNAEPFSPPDGYESYNYKFETASAVSADSANGAHREFTEAEKKELERINSLISAETAEKIARQNKYFGITDEYELKTQRISKSFYPPEKYIYTLSFENPSSDEYEGMSVSLDAKSGEILSFSKYEDYEEIENLPEDIIKAKADEIFAFLAPEKVSQYRFDSASERRCTYYRYENNVRVDCDSVVIEINPKDLSLSSYRIEYTDVEFPSVEGVLSNEEICARLFEQTNYTLSYLTFFNEDEEREETALIYALDEFSLLNPFTGAFIDYNGKEIAKDLSKITYTDISNHYAEKEINALKRFGIGFDDALFRPDEPISQREFLSLLVLGLYGNIDGPITKATLPYDYTDDILKDEEKNPDGTVSRMIAAKYISRALRIDKYAELEHIYNCPFEDVSFNKGYVTLLWGMGIIKGTSESTFSPDGVLTRAQSAILVYNTMEKGLNF